MQSNIKLLEKALGKEKASQLVKEIKKYDKYVLKVKTSLNALVEPLGYEVVLGLAFVPKKAQEKDNGSTN